MPASTVQSRPNCLLSRWLCLACCAALLTTLNAESPSRADETLTGLRADVRTPPENDDDLPPRSHRDDDDCDSGSSSFDDDESDSSFLGLCAWAVASPFWGPHVLMMDSFSNPGYFAHYPYQYDIGYMLIDPPEALGLDGPCQPHWWAARVRGEFGTGFDDLDWVGGRVLLDTSPRWGLESDVRYVREDLDAGRDSLWLGDANVLYRFAQSEFLQFHTGLGMNFLSDTVGSDFGFNFTYGFDCQPVRPLVFSTELDLGTLGHASVVHVRTTAGVVWGVSEAYIGYDLYDIGRAQVQGLVAGVQIWY
jgi:hypothetical protein